MSVLRLTQSLSFSNAQEPLDNFEHIYSIYWSRNKIYCYSRVAVLDTSLEKVSCVNLYVRPYTP